MRDRGRGRERSWRNSDRSATLLGGERERASAMINPGFRQAAPERKQAGPSRRGEEFMATSRDHYSPFTLTLHWVTAALVLCQPLLVWLTEDLAKEEKPYWIGVHQSIRATLLILTLVRLVSRLSGHRAIPLPDQMPGWEKFIARGTHVLFYVLLIAM